MECLVQGDHITSVRVMLVEQHLPPVGVNLWFVAGQIDVLEHRRQYVVSQDFRIEGIDEFGYSIGRIQFTHAVGTPAIKKSSRQLLCTLPVTTIEIALGALLRHGIYNPPDTLDIGGCAQGYGFLLRQVETGIRFTLKTLSELLFHGFA